MKIRSTLIPGCAILVLGSTTLGAKEREAPKEVDAVYACRAIPGASERLACFDAAAAALAAAVETNAVAFDDGKGRPDFEELDTTIERAGQLASGRWSFVLADGRRWVQIEDETLYIPPKRGDRFLIKRGIAGNFRANIEGRRAIRIKPID